MTIAMRSTSLLALGIASVATTVTFVTFAEAVRAQPARDVAAESEIRAMRARSNDAIARRDTNALGDVLLPTYHIVTGRSAQTHGAEAARHDWAEIFRTDPAAIYVRTTRELRVNTAWGLAEELGDWDGRVTMSGTVAHVGGSYAAKWARTVSGAWRLQSEVFTTLRCAAPAPATCAPPDPPR